MSKQLILRPDHAGWTGYGSTFDNSLWFQWRQSGLKSGGRGSWSKNFHFAMQNSIFSGNFTQKIPFLSRQKLVIYSYFWANYSISLQKYPLSNILPVQCT